MSAWYRGATGLLEPVAPLLLRLREPDPADRRERLGHADAPQGAVWWHAASLGEVAALGPVLRGFRERRPGVPVAVTTTTTGGRERARALDVPVSLAPLDLPRTVRRAVAARRPAALVLVETELWPNLLRAVERSGAPTAMVNARISDRSWPRYRRVRGALAPRLAALAAVAARTDADAERLLALGARREALRVTGNTKHDALPEDPAPMDLPWPAGTEVVVAGSVHPDEADGVLEAFRILRGHRPGVRLVLAPRHPAKPFDWSEPAAAHDQSLARRSAPRPDDADHPVLLLDTLGELPGAYAAARAVFLGGTWNRVGGHNPLEPVACGAPVAFGPGVRNAREDADRLLAAGAAATVADARALAGQWERWLADPGAHAGAVGAGRAVVAALRGSAARALDWLGERGVLPGEHR